MRIKHKNNNNNNNKKAMWKGNLVEESTASPYEEGYEDIQSQKGEKKKYEETKNNNNKRAQSSYNNCLLFILPCEAKKC